MVAAGALVAIGCSGNGDAAPTTTLVPTPTSTTESTMAVAGEDDSSREAEVVAAYEAAARSFIDAALIPDPDFPALLATHVDPMLDQRRGVLTQMRVQGRIIRYPDDSQYRIDVQSVELEDDDVAILRLCVVDDGERVDVATGQVVGEGVTTVAGSAAMRLLDGRWRLAERIEEERWDGVAGCARD